MQINKLCKKYGLSRKTVHFYIECGLLNPKKLVNNYYDFSDADIKKLELIIKLRKAGLSIENIGYIFEYPSCTNFFLFKQRYQLKIEIEQKSHELNNINTIIANIPPNGTDVSASEISEQFFIEKDSAFDEMDELLCARMTATFLFTPFMGQKVDDYREFIWNKIVKLTRLELKNQLKNIAFHLAQLDAHTVSQFSSAMANLFINLSKDRYEESYMFLKNEIHFFVTEKQYQETWINNYENYIIPFKKILRSCDSILKEYNSFYTDCLNRFPIIIERIVSETDNELLNRFDLEGSPFNDLFILFCFRYSVFFSPFLEKEKQK